MRETSVVEMRKRIKHYWFIEDQREDCSLSLREDVGVRGRS
jgi:hypothetical protein